MAVTISQNDLKTNIVILNLYSKTATGPLAVAASKLVELWATQLTDSSRRELSIAGIDLEGYGG